VYTHLSENESKHIMIGLFEVKHIFEVTLKCCNYVVPNREPELNSGLPDFTGARGGTIPDPPGYDPRSTTEATSPLRFTGANIKLIFGPFKI